MIINTELRIEHGKDMWYNFRKHIFLWMRDFWMVCNILTQNFACFFMDFSSLKQIYSISDAACAEDVYQKIHAFQSTI